MGYLLDSFRTLTYKSYLIGFSLVLMLGVMVWKMPNIFAVGTSLERGTFSLNSTASVFIALIPILWLMISLGFLRMPAYKACIIGFSLSLVISIMVWQMPYISALRAALEGTVLALFPIVWVISAAFFTYNVSLHTGAMNRMKNLMSSLSGDRRIQALTIAWGFGGFLESVAGFGTAVAIPASILIALGFRPFFAAIICLMANTIAVAFGVVGIPVTTLAKIAELPIMPLSLDIVLQLTPFVVLVPFLIIFTITKSLAGFKGVWITTFVAGLSFGISQFVIAKYVGPELPAVIGSVISFGATIASAKIFRPSQEWRFPDDKMPDTQSIKGDMVGSFKDQIIAWIPYILLLILVLGTSLVPFINTLFSQVKSVLLIYNGTGGKPLYIDWLLTPGTLIMICSIIGGLIQGASLRNLAEILGNTFLQLRKTAVTIIAIVSMAKILGYSGMVNTIAVTLADTTGRFYPLFAPMIGALGTFITGSDTSSNVLFGLLQKQTALQIGANPSWIAAANSSGACAGKLISPQSIAIATAATNLVGNEGEILTITFKYVVGFIIGLGLITYIFAF